MGLLFSFSPSFFAPTRHPERQLCPTPRRRRFPKDLQQMPQRIPLSQLNPGALMEVFLQALLPGRLFVADIVEIMGTSETARRCRSGPRGVNSRNPRAISSHTRASAENGGRTHRSILLRLDICEAYPVALPAQEDRAHNLGLPPVKLRLVAPKDSRPWELASTRFEWSLIVGSRECPEPQIAISWS